MRFDGSYWSGMIAGSGLGLMLGAALVEVEALTSNRRAWASVLGIALLTAGNLSYLRYRKKAC